MTIILLLSWASWANVGTAGIYEQFNYSARGYDTMKECRLHLKSLVANLPEYVEVVESRCVEGIK
jgi:hypothetical protein